MVYINANDDYEECEIKVSKLSKACNISQKTKEIVYERDNGLCVICGKQGIPNMHYIARGQLGLGIEQNIVTGCLKCHHEYDNGGFRKQHKKTIRKYLQSKYEDWNEEDLIYKKCGKLIIVKK